ncbi:MAG TPA: hypothetical protein VGC74_02330 [Stenotrophomonas sp.]|jgi:hypothetical protein
MSEPGASQVAAYISAAIEKSSKTQLEISAEAGFPKSSVLSMIKQGHTKVPLARIPQLARALEVDPLKLLRLAMGEYMPELLRICDQMYQRDAFTDAERAMVEQLRACNDEKPLRTSLQVKRAFEQLLEGQDS